MVHESEVALWLDRKRHKVSKMETKNEQMSRIHLFQIRLQPDAGGLREQPGSDAFEDASGTTTGSCITIKARMTHLVSLRVGGCSSLLFSFR